MLPEFILPGMRGTASFAPLKGKVFQLFQRKGPRDAVVLLQEFQHVFTGLKIPGQGLALPTANYRCFLLGFAAGRW